VKERIIRKDWLVEYETLKNTVLERFGEETLRNLRTILSKLGTYHYNKNKYMLLGKEKLLYDFLIENSYNPYTVYRWALLENVPEEIRFQLKNKIISQKKAQAVYFERRHQTKQGVCEDIFRMGMQLLRSM